MGDCRVIYDLCDMQANWSNLQYEPDTVTWKHVGQLVSTEVCENF